MRRAGAAVAAMFVGLGALVGAASSVGAADRTACDVLTSKDLKRAKVDAGKSQLVGNTPEVTFCRYADGLEVTVEHRTKPIPLPSGKGVEEVDIGAGAVVGTDDSGKQDYRAGVALGTARDAVRIRAPLDELSHAQVIKLLKAAVARI
jgi:hypothetical protein